MTGKTTKKKVRQQPEVKGCLDGYDCLYNSALISQMKGAAYIMEVGGKANTPLVSYFYF